MPTENRSSNTEMAWSPAKPIAPGAYWVLGNGLDQDALVQVINDDGELRCNLHRPTTETDFGYGYAISDLSDDFEWLGPLKAAPAPQPHAEPVAHARICGVEFDSKGNTVSMEIGVDNMPVPRKVELGEQLIFLDDHRSEVERLRAALKFYADREHYHFESGNWDTVSGEPLNILWCGDEPDFIEDGSVARAALSASAEPSAPVDLAELVSEDELRDLASSACQSALAHGISEDWFLSLARTVEQRARAKLSVKP